MSSISNERISYSIIKDWLKQHDFNEHGCDKPSNSPLRIPQNTELLSPQRNLNEFTISRVIDKKQLIIDELSKYLFSISQPEAETNANLEARLSGVIIDNTTTEFNLKCRTLIFVFKDFFEEATRRIEKLNRNEATYHNILNTLINLKEANFLLCTQKQQKHSKAKKIDVVIVEQQQYLECCFEFLNSNKKSEINIDLKQDIKILQMLTYLLNHKLATQKMIIEIEKMIMVFIDQILENNSIATLTEETIVALLVCASEVYTSEIINNNKEHITKVKILLNIVLYYQNQHLNLDTTLDRKTCIQLQKACQNLQVSGYKGRILSDGLDLFMDLKRSIDLKLSISKRDTEYPS